MTSKWALHPTREVAGCAARTFISTVIAASAALAQETNPLSRADREIFTLSGQVVDNVGGNLVLRHEGGRVEVNFSGWPERLPSGPTVMNIGDNVTVSGWLNADFIQSGSLDIVGVYVEDRHAFFTLGAPPEDGSDRMRPLVVPTDTLGRDSDASIAGTVVELRDEGFLLAAGPAEIGVDTSGLFYNPYDDVGEQKLEAGDRVLVTGSIGSDFPNESVIRADSITDIYIVENGG